MTERTIYRTGRGGAASEVSGAATPRPGSRSRRKRRLRDSWWLPPLLALAILLVGFVVISFFLLGGMPLLQYVGITAAGHHFPGSWGASDRVLGDMVVTVSGGDGGRYTIAGLRLGGGGTAAATVKDDTLTASGGSGGDAWTVSLSFLDKDQLRAVVTFADGRPSRETILTRR